MTSRSDLTLSDYDQSLGIGTPSLYRLFYLKRMPDVERLVFGLSKALERFPRFATRIVLADNGRSMLVPLEEPLLVELLPPASWTAEAFRLEDVPHFVRNLTTEAKKPVLGITLTPVTNGAVLSVSCSHAVGDMYSYYLFNAYWNEQLGLAVDMDVTPHQDNAQVASVGSSPVKEDYSLENAARASSFYDVIDFAYDELEALRSELKMDDAIPSLNEALTAYIVHRFGSKLTERTSDLRLRIPVNLRGIHPLVREDYIGNAISEVLVPLDKLTDTPAAARTTAHEIRKGLLAARKPSNIQSTIAVDDAGIRMLGPALPVYDESTDILATNVSRMQFHKLNFGSGAPVRVFGLTYKGLRIAAAPNGLEVHIRGSSFSGETPQRIK